MSKGLCFSVNRGNGYRLMVDRSSSKRCVPIRIRLAVIPLVSFITKNLISGFSSLYYNRAINLIGKELSCRESRCRIVADLARLK